MKSRLTRFALLGIAIAVALAGMVAFIHVSASTGPTAQSSQVAAASSSAADTSAASPSPTDSPSLEPTASASRSPSVAVSATPTAKSKIPNLPIAGGYTFPIRGCSFAYSHYHHDYPANDIYVAIGCSFVAPTSGVVDEVSLTDKWAKGTRNGATRGGLTVSIVGNDGVRYYGAHLSAVAAGIRPGVHVTVGQLLGKTGNSGNAKGEKPHLHFGISWPTAAGIWWVRRGEVYPWPYLDAWRSGNGKSPVGAVAAKHKAVGDGPCTVYC